MQPHEVAQLIGIHPNTVRTWTGDKRYRRFFSATAQGGSGQARDMTDDDIRVLTFINQLKNEGRLADEVEASLVQAQSRGFENLPLPRRVEALMPTPVIPLQAAEATRRGDLQALEIMREEMQERLAEFRELVTYERGRADQERTRLDQSNDRILELTQKVGELEGKLSIIERQLSDRVEQ